MDQPPSSAVRRSLKRKLEQQFEEESVDQPSSPHRKPLVLPPRMSHQDFLSEVASQVAFLNSCSSSSESDRFAAKHAAHVLCELAKNGNFLSLLIIFYRLPFLIFLYHAYFQACSGIDKENSIKLRLSLRNYDANHACYCLMIYWKISTKNKKSITGSLWNTMLRTFSGNLVENIGWLMVCKQLVEN